MASTIVDHQEEVMWSKNSLLIDTSLWTLLESSWSWWNAALSYSFSIVLMFHDDDDNH